MLEQIVINVGCISRPREDQLKEKNRNHTWLEYVTHWAVLLKEINRFLPSATVFDVFPVTQLRVEFRLFKRTTLVAINGSVKRCEMTTKQVASSCHSFCNNHKHLFAKQVLFLFFSLKTQGHKTSKDSACHVPERRLGSEITT